MSTDQQEDSPATQGQHTAEFCERNQLHWTRTYYDLGISGAELAKRPGMLALLTDAEKQRPACIVFYKLDRAFRNSMEQTVAMRRLKKLGIKVLKVRDPNIDGPQGDLVDSMLGAVNQFERELTGLRIRDHNLAMAQRGEWTGGPAPFGYQYRKPIKETKSRKAITITPGGLEPHPAEWAIAQQIWEWALEGVRLGQILDRLNAAGHVRRKGGAWNFSTLYRMLGSRVYAGFVGFGHHSGPDSQGEWFHGRHTTMVTEQQFHQIQVSLLQGNRGQRQSRKPRTELAGLIRCGLCGGTLNAVNTDTAGEYSYTCIAAARREAAHPYYSRRDWVIHDALMAVVDAAVGSLPRGRRVPNDTARREAVEQDIARLQRQLSRLRELYVLGEFSDDLAAYQQRKLGLEAQIKTRQHELAAVGPDAGEVRRRLDHLRGWALSYKQAADVAARQRLWRSIIEHIEATAGHLRVWLRDLGPDVEREWTIALPPPGVRRLGTNQGGGKIVGQAADGRLRSWAAQNGITPVPVTRAVSDP